MYRKQHHRTEFFLHVFTIAVFILFVGAFIANNSDSELNADASSIVSETSIEFDALPAAPPLIPDYDEKREVSVNSDFYGINSDILSILEANRNIQVEYLQLGHSFLHIQPSLAMITFVKKDFSPRGEIYPAIS